MAPSDKTLEHNQDFRIKHYAGDVTYSVLNFIDKNKDMLFVDFKRLLYNRFMKIPILIDLIDDISFNYEFEKKLN